MKIEVIENTFYLENTYIIYKNNKCLIIDPGSEVDKQKDFINKNNLEVLSILITHYHKDHICGLNSYNNNIIDFKSSSIQNIDDFKFEIISTPGHTNDSVSFYFEKEKLMFTGDFLFKESIGRYDFPNSSYEDMVSSLNKIREYNENIIIYPGHGSSSTLEYEIKNNSYMNGNIDF